MSLVFPELTLCQAGYTDRHVHSVSPQHKSVDTLEQYQTSAREAIPASWMAQRPNESTAGDHARLDQRYHPSSHGVILQT